MTDVLECRTFSRNDDIGKQREVRVDMGASLDGRDHRNADVRDVLQGLETFVVNSAPDPRIGDISKRCPFYVRKEIPDRAGKDNNLVLPVLSDPVKGIDKLRVSLRVDNERAAVAMELSNQHTFVITGQVQMRYAAK
jgi:hypothetical protein